MNYLYLIGNGFDLAHGLPTSYRNFVFDFFEKSINNQRPFRIKDVDPISITNLSNSRYEGQINILEELFEFCNLNNIKIEFKNSFLEEIAINHRKNRWVDIEYFYYQKIIDLIKIKQNNDIIHDFNHELIKLNHELWEIKALLINYLKSINFDNVEKIDSICSHIRKVSKGYDGQNLFLNFNYTNVIEKYLNSYRGDEIINIHGTLNDNLSDIIFGYGDEMDSMYPEIEKLNINSLLHNFKSFGYLKKSNYQKLQSFLQNDFEVIIMGHSCGISDRVLLNAIFTNKNCKKIHICYHDRSKSYNDFFEKTQEISRHFGKANKEEMRIKIVPFDQSKPLIPFCEN